MKKIIDLYPETPNEWLWRDHDYETPRVFLPSCTPPFDEIDLWHECTSEEKEAWEREHPVSEPSTDE